MDKYDNAKLTFLKMPLTKYFNRPHQMKYHNLCRNLKPPHGVGSLLGLGLKFCIQPPTPSPDILDKSFDRFFRDVRLRYHFTGIPDEIQEPMVDKKIYVKSTWDPKRQENEGLETNLHNFRREL